MNVSSLTPLLPDFHTVQFSVSSGCFFVFKFVVVLLLVVQGGTVCLQLHLGQKSQSQTLKASVRPKDANQ